MYFWFVTYKLSKNDNDLHTVRVFSSVEGLKIYNPPFSCNENIISVKMDV